MKTRLSHSLFGKIVATLFAVAVVLFGVCFGSDDAKKVYAADLNLKLHQESGDFYYVEFTDKDDVKSYVGDKKPGTIDGYVFAGWYTDIDCTEAIKNDSQVDKATTDTFYAKYVLEDVLSTKVQISTKDVNVNDGVDTRNMRFVSSVDNLNYRTVGFALKYEETEGSNEWKKFKNEAKIVFERIESATEGDEYKFSPKVVDTKSEYFMTATWKGDDNASGLTNFETNYYVRAYWVTLDGVTEYGPTRYVSVNDGLNTNIVNMSVKNSSWTTSTTTLTTDAYTGATVSVAYQDGTYAHLKINLGTGKNRADALKSVTKFTITNTADSTTEEAIYRNLYTKYTGTGTEDKSWYEVYGTAPEEYVIATAADLYGLASIVNGDTFYFSTTSGPKTIYVVADIEVNKGRATESGWSTFEEDGTTAIEGATSHVWTPIGYEGKNFVGIFDGQGHEISGLNGTPTTTVSEAYLGLFGLVGTGGELKNFRLTNSYFEERTTGTNYTGSIAGRTNGNIDSVYSDAYVKGYTMITGGIVGRTHSTSVKTISNCCYAGTMILEGSSVNRCGGIVGQQWAGTLTIENCLFSGEISYSNGVTGNIKTGGFVGHSVTGLTIKNSLNSGEFVNVDSATVTTTGRVLGQNGDPNAAGQNPVTLENIYVTNVGDNTTFWYNPGGLAEDSEEPVMLEESDITGNLAYFNKILDYSDKGAWALVMADDATGVADSTPVLKSFADIAGVEPAIPEVPEGTDINWYNGLEVSAHTICNNTEDNDANVAELNGFAYLANEGIDFDNMTVSMLNKVTVNTGTMDTWDTTTGEGLKLWTPIATLDKPFAGTFDGGNYTISGLCGIATTEGMGLFRATAEGSIVKNFKLTNSYFETSSSKYGTVGSIVGHCAGNLENIYSDAQINSTNQITGGLVGRIWSNGDVHIKNCWFDGSVTSTQSYAAGIAAWVQNGSVLMNNCLNTGTIHYEHTGFGNTGGLCANIMLYRWESDKEPASTDADYADYSASLTIQNSLNAGQVTNGTQARVGSILGNKSGNTTMTIENVYATNESYKLNDVSTSVGRGLYTGTVSMVNQSDITGLRSHYNNILVDTEEWVPTETTPALKAFADGLITESTDDINIDWFEGFNTTEYRICDEATNAENVAELNGFAYLVNAGISFDGMTVYLDKNVDVNVETITTLTEEQRASLAIWTPIGTFDNPFAGTFEGGSNTISGLYGVTETEGMGLFRATAEGSLIKNFKLKNSYFETSSSKYGTVGSIVGHCAGDLENIYSDAQISSTNQITGGLVGRVWSNGDVHIKNCWYDGSVTSTQSYAAGIVAWVQNGSVLMNNCLNTGTVHYEHTGFGNTGGLCANIMLYRWESDKEPASTDADYADYSASLTIQNSLNAGQVTNGTQARVGSILGNKSGNTTMTIENVYATNESYKLNDVSTPVGRGLYTGTIVMVDKSDITGEMAFYNKVLVDSVDTAWSLTTGTPVLTIFMDEMDGATALATPEVEETINIDWYQGFKANEHYICTETEDNALNVKQLYGLQFLVNQKGIDFDDMTIYMSHSVSISGDDSDWDVDNETYKSTGEKLSPWTPIGTDTFGFAGTFDGQKNTISGLFVKTSEQGAGLFKYTTEGSTIKNLKLVGSYIWSTNTGNAMVGSVVGSCGGNLTDVYSSAYVRSNTLYAGGIAGQLHGTGTIILDGCWFAGTVHGRSNSSNAGGIAGLISSGTITMKDCLNSGMVIVGKTAAGGFFGRTFNKSNRWTLDGNNSTISITIEDCLATGLVQGNKDIGSAIGFHQKGTVTISKDSVVYATTNSEATTEGRSGEIQGASGGTLTGTITPVAKADIIGSAAYYSVSGLDFSEIGKWVLIDGKEPQLRAFADEDGRLPVPETTTDVAWYDVAEDNYTIDTADELMGFSYLSNLGMTFAGKTICLGADIDLNKEWTASEIPEVAPNEWTPIGTETRPFAGTFDGKNQETAEIHTISGLYVDGKIDYMGFFGVTGYGTEIKNFRIRNSYFNEQALEANGDSAGFVGSVVGELRGNMSNVYSDAIVKSGFKQTGGLVARAKSATIKNCWFNGKVIGGDTGRYMGGIVASIVQGTCNIENVLFTGVIDSDHSSTEEAVYIGGIVAETMATSINLNLKSVISAGEIIGDNNHMLCNSIVARAKTDEKYLTTSDITTVVTFENVIATRDCAETVCSTGETYTKEITTDEGTQTITASASTVGTVLQTTGDDRLIGYITQKMVTGTDAETGENIVTDISLDFTENWSLRTDGVPVPTKLVDMATNVISSPDAKTMAKEIGLDYWNAEAEITNAESYGAGNYRVTYDLTTDGPTYKGYIAKLVDELKFEFYADNSAEDDNSVSDMNSDGVYASTYYKAATATTGEWVLNITYVEKESKIYISINTDLNSRDDNLQSATKEGSRTISLGMIEQVYTTPEGETKYDYGNSFAFQLPDGHFIVNDGGRAANADELVAYLKEQATAAGLDGVYIDAWIISHYHDDHCGALSAFFDDPTLRDGVYLKAVYASEPSAYALDAVEDQLGVMNLALRGAMTLTQEPVLEGGTAEKPNVYQLHMGQRYYFNGMTMDVIDTQEQHPVSTWGDKNVPDAFNTSSTNCVFTFADGNGTAKKVLIGGDATTVNMEYIIGVYGNENGASKTLHDIDVFAAYHHGHNTTAVYEEGTNLLVYNYKGKANYDWANFLLNNNTDSKFDVVLFPFYKVYEMYADPGNHYAGDDGLKDYPYNIGEINDYFAKNSAAYYTYGYDDCLTTYTESNPHGTVKLTFGTTIEVKAYESLKTAQ